jgi:hypothetical protein
VWLRIAVATVPRSVRHITSEQTELELAGFAEANPIDLEACLVADVDDAPAK